MAENIEFCFELKGYTRLNKYLPAVVKALQKQASDDEADGENYRGYVSYQMFIALNVI